MKIVLAFSGGLDTSFAVVYLRKQGHQVVTATVNTGGFTDTEMETIERKAMDLGALKHYGIQCEAEFFDRFISKIIKANAVYEGKYPLLCADRYIIAQKVGEIARNEGAEAVAHGSTAMGNDQVRFDSAFACLMPELKAISPIKEAALSRAGEVEFLSKAGFAVENKSKRYSINENIMGVTASGSEIDRYEEPLPEVYKLTAPMEATQSNAATRRIGITFEAGVPIKLNGEAIPGHMILKQLNTLVGGYSWGRDIYSGNCIIGIKGRIVFEAPGLLALIMAHQALEQLILTKAQTDISAALRIHYANFIYNGLYFDPSTSDLEAYFDSVQGLVSGDVELRLSTGQLSISSLKSERGLVDRNIADYAQSCSWSPEDANGFIKLFTLQERLANKQVKT